MENREGADDGQLSELIERADRLISTLGGKADQRGVAVSFDNRIDNSRSERAAWACGIACAVCLTIMIMQAFQIHSLQRANEAMHGQVNRMQDYLNYIYQQAPHLRKQEPSK